jgi:ferredoxin-type protein NapG
MAAEDPEQTGTPYIDPDLAACVVCEELACMKACPSGALKLVAEPRQIEMGLARVDQAICVRSQGRECTLCVDKCPIGSEALDLDERQRVRIKSAGCVGCGACQFYCPTVPKAVVVDPH